MKKVLVILLLLFTIKSNLNSMIAPETAQKQPSRSSTLPKILHNIAYSERVGKFCSWLFKPITECCKSERLRSWFASPQETSPELGEHPLVKFTKVNQTTSTRVSRVKKSVAIISIGLLILFNLPQASAVFDNLQDYLKPTICVQNESFKRCCIIEDNMHISCCTTDNMLGIEVCKDFLVTMPETASIPFQDLSHMKDQCSADLTPQSHMIRQEFDGIMQRIQPRNSPYITIPDALDSAPQFANVIQGYLENLGIPRNAPLCVVFSASKNTTSIFLDAELFKTPIDDRSYYSKRYPDGGLAILHLRSKLLETVSVDENLAITGHELGHLLSHLRATAQKYLYKPVETLDLQKHNEEIFADLVGGLLTTERHAQTSMLKQHLAQTNQISQECIIKNLVEHPPALCRIAYLDNLQNQLPDLS